MAEMDSSFQIFKVVLPEMITNAEVGSRVYKQIYAPMFAIVERYFQQLLAEGGIDTTDSVLTSRLFASPFLGLMMLRMMGDEHVAANWENYTEAMGQFLQKALEKNGDSPV